MIAALYKWVAFLATPALDLLLQHRLKNGKEDPARLNERKGIPTCDRPPGPLVWIHAASVGEALSVLCLIDAMQSSYRSLSIMITTGTVTSARLLSTRLPDSVIHQYVPLDSPVYVRRFLDYWEPDLALWVESEFWPNLLAEINLRCIPALLINARLSQKSFIRWKLVRGWIKDILSVFQLCLTQTHIEAERLKALGADAVSFVGNLKYAAAPLPFDERQLAWMKDEIGDRPFWLMASTHEGEEEIAFTAHRVLRKKYPGFLTIIAPRHPVRAEAIAAKAKLQNLLCLRRSAKGLMAPSTDIYLVDTMGELGLFYRLSIIVCMGGSFVWGGHNPIEAADLGCALLFGPRMTNFAEIAKEMLDRKAAIPVPSAEELPSALLKLFESPDHIKNLAITARSLAYEKKDILDQIMLALKPWLAPLAGTR